MGERLGVAVGSTRHNFDDSASLVGLWFLLFFLTSACGSICYQAQLSNCDEMAM
jgi:hypothetical protein